MDCKLIHLINYYINKSISYVEEREVCDGEDSGDGVDLVFKCFSQNLSNILRKQRTEIHLLTVTALVLGQCVMVTALRSTGVQK